MGHFSVFPDDESPTSDELISFGRKKLIKLQNEAAHRLDHLTRTYGSGPYPIDSKRNWVQWNLKQDILTIEQALKELDKREGILYHIRVLPTSREDIAERLVLHRKRSMDEARNDEGVPTEIFQANARELHRAEEEASQLKKAGYPLTSKELAEAKIRLSDRTVRMKYGGVRRMDNFVICNICRASIFEDSIYCSKCGNLIGIKPKRTVFICYGSPDKKWVQDLALCLKQSNIDAWLDTWELIPGDSIIKEIDNGLEKSEIFLLIASKESLKRPWPILELKAAINKRIKSQENFKIIPLFIDDCKNDLFWLLQDNVYIKFYGKDRKTIGIESKDGQELINKLKNAILGFKNINFIESNE